MPKKLDRVLPLRALPLSLFALLLLPGLTTQALAQHRILAASAHSPTVSALPQQTAAETAKKVISEAEQLMAKGTAEARRAALVKYREAAVLFHELGDKTAEASAINDIGAVYDGLGEKQKALEYLNQALPLRRAVGDRQGEATTLNNLGAVRRSLGDVREAVTYYEQSLAITRSLQDRESEAVTLNNLGAVYRALGELQKSLDVYAEALPLWQALKNRRGEAVTLSNLGGVYRSLGEPEKALEFYTQSLVGAREAKDRRIEAETLNNIGTVHRSLEDQPKALEFFNQALELRRAVGDRRGEAGTLNNLGSSSVSLNQPQKALEYYEQSLKLWRAVADRSGEGGTLHNIGEVFYITGDREKALKHFNDALLLRRSVEDYQGEAYTLYGIARIERDQGRDADARRDIESVIAIVETLRSKVASPELRASYFANVQKYYEFYVDLLMSLHQQTPTGGFATAALQVSEQARARSLLDLLQEARADLREAADAKLLARDVELLALINAKAAQQSLAYANPQRAEFARTLGAEINQLSIEYEAVEAQIRIGDRRYSDITATRAPTLAAIQAQLGDQTILLEYKLGEKRSHVWFVTTDRISAYELPGRNEIETLSRQLYESLIERNRRAVNESSATGKTRIGAADKQVAETSARLSEMILGPMASEFGSNRLVVVADGALQFVPFGVLPAPRGDQPLTITNEIVSLPSIAVLAQLRRHVKHSSTNKSLAAFADPVFESDDPRLRMSLAAKPAGRSSHSLPQAVRNFDSEQGATGLPRLLASREEVQTIVGFASPKTYFKAFDFDASQERAVSAETSEYRILHFATHGLLNATRPEFSGIILSLYDKQGNPRDGFLRLNQIYKLNLSSDLVVLSACRTALGKEVKGEGLIGLTRGFMYAGAPRVVASLWKVNDEATAELMKHFYQNHLQKKLAAAPALRLAQVQMQKQDRWRSPYYWGAFVIQGDWR
jgi:CHAT domain-containing protein/tetratricopeptide (TPR) repeat protein